MLRNATLADGERADIGIEAGRIAAIAPHIESQAPAADAGGRLVVPGFVETHLHLDKACILDRCRPERGTLEEAIGHVARAKRGFTHEDVTARAGRALDKAIVQGTMRVRTHVEVDPVIGLTGFKALRALADDYRWAVDVEICVFPQEGLTNNPGTEELMRTALRDGARVVGAAPYTDSDPRAQIDRVFRMAADFDVDIDMHLDLGDSAEYMDAGYVCEMTERHRYGGRVTIGHVTKMSLLSAERFDELARRLADAGVAVTVLPSTDLFLMGRNQGHAAVRGVLAAHKLLAHGVNCSLATNNVLNPFTPYGDCSLVRMANLYANVLQLDRPAQLRECFDMLTERSARLLNLKDYGFAPGHPADIVILDAETPEQAIAEISRPLACFKNGRQTVRWHAPELLR